MSLIVWIITIPVLIFGLMEAYPRHALAIIAELRRRFRLYLINRYGQKAAEAFMEQMRVKYAGKGFDMEEFERLLEECRPEIVERLGTHYADDFLGEPSYLERYF